MSEKYTFEADEADKTFAKNQFKKYMEFAEALETRGIKIPCKHVCNSAGIIDIPEGDLDMVRFGVTLYGMYIPMFIMFIRKSKELNGFKRYVMPILGLCGCVFMVYAAFAAYGKTVLFYLIVFAVIMAIGNLFYRKKAD